MKLDTEVDVISLYSDLDIFYKANSRKYNLLNPRYKFDNRVLSWQNHISNEKFETYPEYFEWVISEVQYSLMLSDESVVQIYFEGEKNKKKFVITKGSMAYLPRPDKYSEYFRFDVDAINARDFDHTAYHIHFGYKAKDTRFCMFEFPFPSEFIKLILSMDYGISFETFNPKKVFKNLDSFGSKYNHSFRLTMKK